MTCWLGRDKSYAAHLYNIAVHCPSHETLEMVIASSSAPHAAYLETFKNTYLSSAQSTLQNPTSPSPRAESKMFAVSRNAKRSLEPHQMLLKMIKLQQFVSLQKNAAALAHARPFPPTLCRSMATLITTAGLHQSTAIFVEAPSLTEANAHSFTDFKLLRRDVLVSLNNSSELQSLCQ